MSNALCVYGGGGGFMDNMTTQVYTCHRHNDSNNSDNAGRVGAHHFARRGLIHKKGSDKFEKLANGVCWKGFSGLGCPLNHVNAEEWE